MKRDEMARHVISETRHVYKILIGKYSARNHLRNLKLNGKLILKWVKL
jgi:hypothetical protein